MGRAGEEKLTVYSSEKGALGCAGLSLLQNQPGPVVQEVIAGDNEEGEWMGVAQSQTSSLQRLVKGV